MDIKEATVQEGLDTSSVSSEWTEGSAQISHLSGVIPQSLEKIWRGDLKGLHDILLVGLDFTDALVNNARNGINNGGSDIIQESDFSLTKGSGANSLVEELDSLHSILVKVRGWVC